MQIHELSTRTPGVYDYAALDTGSQTYKAQVGDLKPQYTSYDSANPTSWAEVATMGSNTPISTFFERVTYIARNVRYLWKLIGSGDFSNVAETLSGAIGNTALTTTATSLSGAIAEHEEDISTINGNLSYTTKTWLSNSDITTTSGTAQGVTVTLVYNSKTAILNGRIRIKDPTTRPTITITNVPSDCPAFSGLYGFPVVIRHPSSNDSKASDVCVVSHDSNSTTIRILVENYIGEFPNAAGGYAEIAFSIVAVK